MIEILKRQIPDSLRSSIGSVRQQAKVQRQGTFREREAHGLVERPHYAYGVLRAADLARFAGQKRVTVCEFGVATGNGLMNMIAMAEHVQQETGVEVRVVGLDSGEGLPVVDGYRDHPELWSPGDFTMSNQDELRKRIQNKAELIFGDIAKTVDAFAATLDESCPLGFIAVDVDIYSGAKSALRSLLGRPELYTPGISMYCDDVQFFFANRWCGELRAIDEFNEEHAMRKIDKDRSLPGRRPDRLSPWYQAMFVCHVLDHPLRTSAQARGKLSLEEHMAFMKASALC